MPELALKVGRVLVWLQVHAPQASVMASVSVQAPRAVVSMLAPVVRAQVRLRVRLLPTPSVAQASVEAPVIADDSCQPQEHCTPSSERALQLGQ